MKSFNRIKFVETQVLELIQSTWGKWPPGGASVAKRDNKL